MPVTRNLKLAIARSDVLSYVGAIGGAEVNLKAAAMTDELLNDPAIIGLLQPAIAYEVLDIGLPDPASIGLPGEMLADRFPGATMIAICVATIGTGIDERIASAFAAREQLKGLILDAVGSAAIDSLRVAARTAIATDPVSGQLQAGDDYSPGCEGWPVEAMPMLANLVSINEIGVSLTRTSMFYPRKSICMIMGLGSGLSSRPDRDRCAGCPNEHICGHHQAVSGLA